MIEAKPLTQIAFQHFTLQDRALYLSFCSDGEERGCEFSFANLYMWGRQRFAVIDGHIVIFSQYDRKSVYPYPVGQGDKKTVIDAIIADAKIRDIPCRITGLSESAVQELEELYPHMFRFHHDESSFDYVYDINDLADLKGKKYHGKRNHFNRFAENYPDYTVAPLKENNVESVRKMASEWYEERLRDNPDADFHMERAALEKAFRDYKELEMEGLVLYSGDEILGFTLGSRMSSDTFDVHFEKARPDVQGAYTAINCEFARYIRDKYPEARYLDREDDMGLEGLRKAKRSYHPHHMIKKYWACLLEDGYDY